MILSMLCHIAPPGKHSTVKAASSACTSSTRFRRRCSLRSSSGRTTSDSTVEGDVEVAQAYEEFVGQHSVIETSAVAPLEAYALHAMLVHDLRRIRLRWPDALEAEPAIELAASRYAQLSRAADEPVRCSVSRRERQRCLPRHRCATPSG